MAIAFTGMVQANISGNPMRNLGAIDFGLIVDGTVDENIIRHLDHRNDGESVMDTIRRFGDDLKVLKQKSG